MKVGKMHKELWIERGQPLRLAMQQLDDSEIKVLVVHQDNILVGTLTDGDVRRYLLSGGSLEDSVGEAAFRTPVTATTREEGERLIRSGCPHALIPVVEENGRLTGVVVAREKPEDQPKLNLPVVIMAGGKGTRLYPYTKILPKPLIPVGDRPILEHIMDRFRRVGCEDFHLIVNHKRELIKAYFNESDHPYHLHWYDEEQPLGTGGGLSMLKGKLTTTFFLINCDILLLSDYAQMLQYHRQYGNKITMVGARKHITIPYGVVDTGEEGQIQAFREKPSFDFLTNTGMYLVEPEVLEDIQEGVSIGFPTIMEQQMAMGRRVGAFEVEEEEWLDMGQIEELQRMEQRLAGQL